MCATATAPSIITIIIVMTHTTQQHTSFFTPTRTHKIYSETTAQATTHYYAHFYVIMLLQKIRMYNIVQIIIRRRARYHMNFICLCVCVSGTCFCDLLDIGVFFRNFWFQRTELSSPLHAKFK